MKTNTFSVNYLTLLIGFSQIYAWATTYYLPAALLQIVPIEMHQPPLLIIGGVSWALLLGGLVAPKIGSYIEVNGGRLPLTLGSIFSGLGLLALSQVHNIFCWYIAWSFIGLGMALGLFNAAFATLGRLLGQQAKTIIVRVTLISGFATLLWPLTTYLIQTQGWRTMAMLYAIPHIILLAPLFYFTIPAFVPEHETSTTEAQGATPKKVKLIFYLLAMYIILRSIVGTTISIDILMMFKGLGLTLALSAASAALIGPAQIGGRILEMYFGSRFSPFNTAIFWTSMLPLAIVILLSVGVSATPVFSVIYGMSNGVLTITMGILPMVLFGVKGYASLLGKLALPTLIAQALTPLLVGPLIQHGSAQLIFILSGILGSVALLCMIILSKLGREHANIQR